MVKLSNYLPDINWTEIKPLEVIGPPDQSQRGAVTLPTNIGDLRISLNDFGFRVQFGSCARDYGLLDKIPNKNILSVSDTGPVIVIESAIHKVEFEKSPLTFSFYSAGEAVLRSTTDGHFIRHHRLPPFSKTEDGWFIHLDLKSDERIYGLGEKWGKLDKRGQLISSFNHDALGVNAETSYKNVPFCWSTNGWGILVHTSYPVTHGVGFAPWSQRSYGLKTEEDVLDLFIFSGQNGAEIIDRYTQLTGRAPIPPDWSMGVIISKAFYRDANELITTARKIRERGMPCDTITIDGRAWQDTDMRFSFDWDKSRYPDPQKVLDELKRLKFKICIWEYPLISVKNPLFTELSERGWLLKHHQTGKTYEYEWDKEPFGNVLTPLPNSGIVDFSHPDAYAYWQDQHKALFEIGIDMIKADFGEQVPDQVAAHNGATGRELHNVYSFLYNKCVYEAAEKYARNGPFLFSRSSWTGCQRFPAQWGGDPQADWEGLAASLRGGLSWGMSGGPYYATDIGGFYADQRDPKLYVRWMQAGIFAAHMRLHGIGAREPWSYGPQAEAAATEALALRYRLLPYLKKVITEASLTGLPVQRAMALAYPDEPESWSFEEQFCLGPDLLIAPCIRPDDQVCFYLPKGDWVRFPGGEAFAGGRCHILTLSLQEFSVFAPKGVQIPVGPPLTCLDDAQGIADPPTFWIAGTSKGL